MHEKYFRVVLILFAICRVQHASYSQLAIETVNFFGSTVTNYMAAEQKLLPDSTAEDVNKNIFELSERLANKFDKLSLQISNIQSNIENYFFEEDYLKQYEKVYKKIDRIDFLYNETRKWAKFMSQNKSWDLRTKTNQMLSLDSDYPQSALFELKKNFFHIRGKNSNSFLKKFNRVLSQVKCNDDLTPHYQLFSLYKQIVHSEVQGMAAMSFAYMWRLKNKTSSYEIDEIKKERIQSILEYTGLFKNEIKFARNFIRRCDVDDKKIIGNNKTYASFENVFYKIVLGHKQFEAFPKLTTYNDINSFKMCQLYNDCYDNNNNKYDEICSGWIENCQKAWVINFCQQIGKNQTGDKNYHWIKVKEEDEFVNYGDTSYSCLSTQNYETFYVDALSSFKNMLRPIYCDCVDENIHTKSNNIRAFSLLWSQTSDNMVATGARLVAKDRMIHIQLREGKLLPYGEIDKKTERWVPLPTFKYQRNFPYVAIYENGTQYQLEENTDFLPIHHLFAKTICLQKLTFEENHLLTGVRFDFEYLGQNLERHFKLEAKYVGFSYDNGNITAQMKYHEQSCKQLPELILNHPDDPLKFDTHPHDSKENQFITIRASDLIKDASQTTIPFFDLLEVAPETSLPIAAIELFHKGQLDNSSGGYISLKLYPINFTRYMDPPSLYASFIIENTTIPEFGLTHR